MEDGSVLQQIPMELSERESRYLTECINVPCPSDVRLKQLMEYSTKFPRKFPVSTMRCSNLLKYGYVDKKILEENANSCYPLLHENALLLYVHFLEHKKKYGNAIENQVYANMGLLDLVQRLLEKRAVCFYGRADIYLLLSGASGIGGWEAIGTVRAQIVDNSEFNFLTGNHDCLASHLYRIGISASPICVLCNDPAEMNEDHLKTCEALRSEETTVQKYWKARMLMASLPDARH